MKIVTSKKQDSKNSPLPKGVCELATRIKELRDVHQGDLDSTVINATKNSDSIGPYVSNGSACLAIEWGAINSVIPMRSEDYTALMNKSIRLGMGKAKPVKRVEEVIDAQVNDTLMDGQDINVWEFNAYLGEGPSSGVVINCSDAEGRALLLKGGKVSVLTEPTGLNFQHSSKNTRFEYSDKKITVDQFQQFRNLFSNLSEEQFFLLMAYITFVISHPRSEGLTYPIAYIHGGPGCGKTTIARMIAKLLGMDNASVQTMPSTVKDLVATVSNNLRVIWDNVSHIKTDISNASCNVSTGGTISSRTLYTNTGVTEVNLHKPLIITAIELASQGDLMDRCAFFNTLKPTESFSSEALMHQSLTDILPEVQSWLLDVSAKALSLVDSVEAIGDHRASTFRLWIAAFEPALGFEGQEIQKHFAKSFTETIKQQSVSFDPVLSSIIHAVKKLAPLGGTPDSVHYAITSYIEETETRMPRNWPANANALSHKLGKLGEILPKHGILFDKDLKKDSKGRRQWLLNTVKDGAKVTKPEPISAKPISYSFLKPKDEEVITETSTGGFELDFDEIGKPASELGTYEPMIPTKSDDDWDREIELELDDELEIEVDLELEAMLS